MKVQVLGSGCQKCKVLTENVRSALAELNLTAEVEKVEDIQQIMQAGVISTPALLIDGAVKSVGRVLSPTEVKKLIESL